jgi:hypothetical protein
MTLTHTPRPHTNLDALQHLSPAQRMDALLSLDDAADAIQTLHPLSLYHLLRDIGPADAIDLTALASPDQLQAFLDLDAWHRDDFHPPAWLEWISPLLDNLPLDEFCEKLVDLDPEPLILTLQEHLIAFHFDEHQEVPPRSKPSNNPGRPSTASTASSSHSTRMTSPTSSETSSSASTTPTYSSRTASSKPAAGSSALTSRRPPGSSAPPAWPSSASSPSMKPPHLRLALTPRTPRRPPPTAPTQPTHHPSPRAPLALRPPRPLPRTAPPRPLLLTARPSHTSSHRDTTSNPSNTPSSTSTTAP